MKTIARLAAAVFILALTASTGAVAAPPLPSTGTLTIPPIAGSSPVVAWSWGASNSGTMHMGGGAGAGNANIQDLSITRYADGLSSLFFKLVAEGRVLDTVVLVDGATTITLTRVLVTAYSTGGSAGEKARTENITFNFAKITYAVNGVSESVCAADSCP